ncbi:Lrp/AsnC family transcriptional regulator [Pseudonocardia bannensis]|uniref:Lrp/AsnC family transcriptional regulator n=1 Tax=Pseudonocardia bannensis TaxID=630973 RepID=A0A848DJ54_9PSEU|nr:Lrp/AsnC family transcriptional regulator [Pseudonocardia bannensis]NMH92566.1 Lrp/AsnC family transcriptional regulator [Pseudonocardia bannensis]
MTSDSSKTTQLRGRRPQDVRSAPPVLDATDRAILRALAADARIPNNALAEQVGIAASTCLTRVRALRERGVIRGFHADIDPRALGHDLEAMIAVRLQAHARCNMSQFVTRLAGLPEVLDVYFVAGTTDYLVHVATSSTDELRWFVAEQLSRHPDVASTETSLIFEHVRAAGRQA